MADKANKEEVQVEDTATQTEVSTKPQKEVSLKESNPEKFLEEFNWHNYEEGIDPIDDGKLAEF